jgi:hypothetical protein
MGIPVDPEKEGQIDDAQTLFCRYGNPSDDHFLGWR